MKIKTNNAKITFDLAGNMTLTMDVSKESQIALKESYDELKDIDLSVDIRKYYKKRSLDANAYAWTLIDKLAFKLGITKEEVYRQAIREIGGNTETVCVKENAADKLCIGWKRNGLGWFTEIIPSKINGCVCVVLYYGSSSYDTEQMSRLIETIVYECKEQGIQTETPEQQALMIERWDECSKRKRNV